MFRCPGFPRVFSLITSGHLNLICLSVITVGLSYLLLTYGVFLSFLLLFCVVRAEERLSSVSQVRLSSRRYISSRSVPQLRSLGVLVGPGRMFLHLSLLLALVGPLGSRLGSRPNLLPPTSGARRRGVDAALQIAMSGLGRVQTSSPQLPSRAGSMVFTSQDPTPTVELYANGTVNQYTSTLSSLRANYKLSTRDVRLLRSSTRVLAPREKYVIFDLGDLKGILQRDRVILIGADRPAATALADELRQRLVVERDDRELKRETPFEVRVIECMLEQTYSLLDEALQRLETMVADTLAELTDPSQAQRERGREAALGRMLPLQLSLNSLQARTQRLASVLEELLDNEEDVAELCLSAQSVARLLEAEAEGPASQEEGEEVEEAVKEAMELRRREVAENLEDEQELVETLLDVYNARLDSLTDRVSEIATSIETTQVAEGGGWREVGGGRWVGGGGAAGGRWGGGRWGGGRWGSGRGRPHKQRSSYPCTQWLLLPTLLLLTRLAPPAAHR